MLGVASVPDRAYGKVADPAMCLIEPDLLNAKVRVTPQPLEAPIGKSYWLFAI
jgi:hypothetical protein